MEQQKMQNCADTECIGQVVAEIAKRIQPLRIYLYNQRKSPAGNVTGFKLCAIVKAGDKKAAEQEVYRHVDCEVPFDVLFYTEQEWETLTGQSNSFAYKIVQMGLIVYG